MTTYTGIPDAQIEIGKPVVQPLMAAMRDDPIAMLEGATGAPINHYAWHPYDQAKVGDGNDGQLWSFTDDGAIADIDWTGLVDGYDYGLRLSGVVINSATLFQVQLFAETSASWVNKIVTSTSIPPASELEGVLLFNGMRTSGFDVGTEWWSPLVNGDNVAIDTDITSPALITTRQKFSGIRLTVTGTFAGGSVHGLRRRNLIGGT